MDGKGYIIPAQPMPDDHYCLKIFIPKDDLYLYAFSGAFQFFGKWLAWERGSDHRGREAAAAWQVAIQRTFAEGWLNCGEDVCEHCELIPLILEQLQELNNMNVSLNCGVGGGGCGCQHSCLPPGAVAPPPGTTYPNPYPDPIPTPDDPLELLWKCNMAHYCAYLWRLWGLYSTTVNGIGLITDSVNQVYDDLGVSRPSAIHAHVVAAVSTMLNVGAGSDDITVPFDANYDYIVCVIYSALTDAAAYDTLYSATSSIFGFVAAGMQPLLSLVPLHVTFSPQDSFDNLPPSYRDRDCSNCGAPTPPPTGEAWHFLNYSLETPFPDVASEAADALEVTGTASTNSTSTLHGSATLDAYNGSAAEGLQAVAFAVTTMSMTPSFTPNSANGMFYGGTNTKTQLLGVVAGGETVLIQRTDYPQPDAGSFDHVFTYEDWRYLISQFHFRRFTYNPPDTAISLIVSDWEARPI